MKKADNQNNVACDEKKGFLKVPNYLLDDLYSDRPEVRNKARVHLYLLKHSYFVAGMIVVNGRKWLCQKGEWVTTYRELERKTQVPKSCIGDLLNKLVEEERIVVRRNGCFTFVRIQGMRVTEKAFRPAEKEKNASASLPDSSVSSVGRPNYNRFKD